MDQSTNKQPFRSEGTTAEDLSGRSLGDFQILRKLGQGGMGQVYLAEQTSLKRKVALKFLRHDLAANITAVSRFRAEAEAVAKINHANIVAVYTVGAFGEQQFMALEYVEGMNLRDYLNRKGSPDLPRAMLIMRQVAAALQRASEAGIVHRDIKPENILLTRKGEVKVTDFGLSRVFGTEQELNLTQSGMTMGTPLYMSPEQVQGKVVDPRSDIYSFGVTCYHMLAGRPPFSGANAFEVALRHINDVPRPLAEQRPDIPAELSKLVMWMMNKNPEHRPQTGREVLRILTSLRGQSAGSPFADLTLAIPETTAAALPAVETAAKSTRPWVKYTAAAALALLFGGAARYGIRPPRIADRSTAARKPEPNDEEKFLLDIVRPYEDATLSPQNAASAFRVHVQLMTLYLDQRRYAEADAFLGQVVNKDPSLQFFRNLYTGILAALQDKPERAVASLKLAYGDKSYRAYLNVLSNPPSREAVDLRAYLLEAIDRIERTPRALPQDVQRAKTEANNYLKRPVPPGNKKA